jgi:DNA-directed RNA polymerase omega subunit
MAREIPDEYDSKFRFIVVASQRAHQLQNGAPPKLKVNSEKPAYIAIREAEANLINYELLVGEEMSEAEEEPSE